MRFKESEHRIVHIFNCLPFPLQTLHENIAFHLRNEPHHPARRSCACRKGDNSASNASRNSAVAKVEVRYAQAYKFPRVFRKNRQADSRIITLEKLLAVP